MQSRLEPGDEVVVIEPAFDIYPAQVQMAGGTCRFVPLRQSAPGQDSPAWVLDMAEFAAAFNDRTKLFILNNPHK
jgi:kynurenine--oxoglutarate transaminase/cysteine-S-conjugate beta-lyase/glutamine--phenylpyruvate transaminase